MTFKLKGITPLNDEMNLLETEYQQVRVHVKKKKDTGNYGNTLNQTISTLGESIDESISKGYGYREMQGMDEPSRSAPLKAEQVDIEAGGVDHPLADMATEG